MGQRRAQAWRARERPATGGLGGQSTRGGAHPEHRAHVRDAGRVEAQRLIEGRRVRDAGRVEAQRLIEGRRVLPSRKQGV